MQLLAAASEPWEESDSSGCDGGVFGLFSTYRDILYFIYKSGNLMKSFEEKKLALGLQTYGILEQSRVVERVIDQS